MVKHNCKSYMIRPFLGLVAVASALAAYSLCVPVAMAQVPAPPATPDLPDVETPAPPTNVQTDTEANVQTDAKAEVQADAKANVQTDTDIDAPANRANINAETDTDVQIDPNAPADTNLRNRTRTRAGTQELDRTDANLPPRLDADSRLQTDTEADLGNRTNGQGQASARTSQRGRLGIQFSGNDGLTIGQVATGGIAARAGLRVRDEIVSINGRPVRTRDDLTLFLNEAQGPTIIEFRRNGQLQEANVNLMAMDDRGDRVQSFYRGPEDEQPAYENGSGYGGRSYYRARRFNRSRRCR